MKTLKYLAILVIFSITIISSCGKKTPVIVKPDPVDTNRGKGIPIIYNYTTLLNQPLDTVKSYLKGKWQMQSKQGGTGLTYYEYKNTFIEFNFNIQNMDSLRWYNDTMMIVNSRVLFNKFQYNPDSDTFLQIKFNYLSLPFTVWYAERANSDSLYIQEGLLNSYLYFLTKVY